MSRVQLALNVANLEESIEFYTKLFGTGPAKMRPGYANFAVVDPPLKLVLIEGSTEIPGSLNHLGVEVGSTSEVSSAKTRLEGSGVTTEVEDHVECCYALQDKVWAIGPGGATWEFYTVLGDADILEGRLRPEGDSASACCANQVDEDSRSSACC